FSFIGYATQEIPVRGRTTIDVFLIPDIRSLEEVVVLGYGVQKKANLTGSVSEIDSETIRNKPVTQVSQLFSGQITGVAAPRPSGEPGGDGAEIVVRGRGTFSSAGVQPLILVDGLPNAS